MTLNHYQYNERPESQNPAIKLLEKLGYSYVAPADAEIKREKNLRNVIFKDDLTEFLKRQTYNYRGNEYHFSGETISKAIRDLDVQLDKGLSTATKEIYDLLIDGKSYEEILVDGSKSSFDIKYIHWGETAEEILKNNIIRVTEEFSVEKFDKKHRRPDIVITVNGIPLVIIECKKSSIDVMEGITQNIKNWQPDEIPHMFKYAQIVMAMNPHTVKYGTCGTGKEFFVPWKEKDTDWLNSEIAKLIEGRTPTEQDRTIISMLSPKRMFDLIRHYILFDFGIKKIARYQQFFGIEKAMNRILSKDGKNSRNGVIWHTQGSGKSLTMVMLVKRIIAESTKNNTLIKTPRFVLVNDRINLDKQLTDNFSHTQMRPSRAKTGKMLKALLEDKGNTIITTVIHKFDNVSKKGSIIDDENIFILIDECHRTQSGNFHNFMRDVLPNAIILGFTGTPLLNAKEKSKTYNRIGLPIDTYTIKQAEEDEVIVPLIYEGRKIPQSTDAYGKEVMENCFNQIAAALNEEQRQDLKVKWSTFTHVAQTEQRLSMIAFAINQHFEYFRKQGFKAIVAESSRASAIRLHQILKTLNVKSAVVISFGARPEGDEHLTSDSAKIIAEFRKKEVEPRFGLNDEKYEDWAKNTFKNGDDIDILIVKDKLLTGFDAPIARVLYVDKPMKDHNLLQAIARVNRIAPGKPNGLIVDFWGLFKQLNSAMDIYTDSEAGLKDIDDEDKQEALKGPEDCKKELEISHSELLGYFKNVSLEDAEATQLYLADTDVRKEFYDKLSNYSNNIEIAMNSYNTYTLIGRDEMKKYQNDLVFFEKLRKSVRMRYNETIDFSIYEEGVKNLLNMFVSSGAEKIVVQPVFITDKEGMQEELAQFQSSRAKADLIRTKISYSLQEKYYEDPILYKTFKELIDDTIKKYEKDRDAEAYFSTMEKMAEDYRQGFTGNKYPSNINDNDHAKAFYGNLKTELFFNCEIEHNSSFDLEIGDLASEILDVFKNKIKPGWESNTILINQIRQEIEDIILDYTEEKAMTYDFDIIDKCEDQILLTAKMRLKNNAIIN